MDTKRSKNSYMRSERSHFTADWPLFTHLKAGDRFASLGYNNLLTCNLLEIANSVLENFLITDRCTNTHVQGDFGNAWPSITLLKPSSSFSFGASSLV